MRCIIALRALLAVAVAFAGNASLCMAGPAVSALRGNESLRGGAAPENFLFFSGVDLWGKGGSGYLGLHWAPGGLNADGFLIKALLAGGQYQYQSGFTDIRGTNVLAAVMPGWRVKRGDVEVKVFAGLDWQHHMLAPDDPANKLRGSHTGVRAGSDVWWQPLPQFALAGSLTGSTIGTSYGARLAAGYRMMDRFWAGPEIETLGDTVYRQTRVGAHVTAFVYGPFEWALGAGYLTDSSNRSGLYGRFSVLTRR